MQIQTTIPNTVVTPPAEPVEPVEPDDIAVANFSVDNVAKSK